MYRKRRNTRSKPTLLSEVLSSTAAGKAAAKVAITFAIWEKVAGVGFARRTRPSRIREGVLYVNAQSSAWVQELSLHEMLIIQRLRKLGFPVERLRFRVAPIEVADRGGVYAPPAKEVASCEQKALPPEALKPLERVADDDLRQVLAAAALAAFRRQEKCELTKKYASIVKAIPMVPTATLPSLQESVGKK